MFATPTAAALHKLPEGYRSLLDSDEDLKPARQYVAKRQVTKKVAKSAKLGAVLTDFESTNDDPDEEVRKAAQKAAFMSRGRVIAPIYDAAEKGLEGWSGRLYVKPRPGSRAPKVLYSDAIARARVLYNAAALYQPSDTPVLLVEGVFDALPYFPDVAAFLGKPSPGQVEVLLGSSRPVVVCLDGDSWLEGEMLGRRLMFEGRNNVAWVKLPPTLDPNDVDANWLREEARRALAGV
jgi:DNA primase